MAVHNLDATILLGPATTIAAGTGDVWYTKFNLPGTWLVTAAHLMPNDAQTANGTNYSTYTLANVTQSTTIATRAYSATNSTAGVAESLTISNIQVASGDVLSWTKAESGTGLAGMNTVIVTLRRII